jgi:hypothetical protein
MAWYHRRDATGHSLVHGLPMKLPSDAAIPLEKLTHYLLVPRTHGDKSAFLARCGFNAENPSDLLASIRTLIQSSEATFDRTSPYGDFYRVDGKLEGAKGVVLDVRTIWIQVRRDMTFRFVTLLPLKGARR